MAQSKAELEAQLTELRAARVRLLTGTFAISIDSPGGQNVKFQAPSLADLDREIARVENAIAAIDGAGIRPIHFGFSKTR